MGPMQHEVPVLQDRSSDAGRMDLSGVKGKASEAQKRFLRNLLRISMHICEGFLPASMFARSATLWIVIHL
jgi:hypothetical protein